MSWVSFLIKVKNKDDPNEILSKLPFFMKFDDTKTSVAIDIFEEIVDNEKHEILIDVFIDKDESITYNEINLDNIVKSVLNKNKNEYEIIEVNVDGLKILV